MPKSIISVFYEITDSLTKQLQLDHSGGGPMNLSPDSKFGEEFMIPDIGKHLVMYKQL